MATSLIIAAFCLRQSGFSVITFVNQIGVVLRLAIIQTGGLGTIDALISVSNYFLGVTLGLVFLTLSFSFAAIWRTRSHEAKNGMVVSLAGAVISFIIIGVTIASAFLALGIVISYYLVFKLSENYAKELKKWVSFRTGTHSVGRAQFVLNIFVALGIFVAVLSALPSYQSEFRTDLHDSISSIVRASLPPGVDQPSIDAQISQQVDSAMSSPIFSAYFRWLPVFTALGVWIVLEFYRLFLPLLAGIFTALMSRCFREKS